MQHVFSNKFSKFRTVSTVLWCCVIGLSVAGCDLASEHLRPDRSAGLEMQDFKDALAEREIPDGDANVVAANSSIPSLQPYIAAASDDLKPMPLVSISVNQTVPLQDVLFELAQQAGYDIEMDAKISGSIIFTVRNRPFDVVIERICDLSGLRYKIEDNVLQVQMDTPYSKVYKINYLSFIRKNIGSVSNDVSVVSGDANSGSSYTSTVESESDFWGELENNLDQMLRVGIDRRRTANTPQISALAQAPNVKAIGIERDGITVQPPSATLQVQSLPPSAAPAEQANGEFSPSFVVNKQAGLVNIYASEKTHKEVNKYLKLLKKAVTAQVLIEAKILEVALSDDFQAGIDWRLINPLSSENILGFSGVGNGFDALDKIAGGVGATLPSATKNFVIGHAGNDFQAMVQALSTFGTTRALASPRVTVINNQSAVLNVATNRIFFELDVETTLLDGGGLSTDVTSEIKNIPEGVLVNVQPSIDLENNTISMVIRPTITSITGFVADPAVAFAVAGVGAAAEGIESRIPEVNVQEIDSVVQMRSGKAIVMGGLLQDRVTGTINGVPVLGELPVFGGLFRNTSDTYTKTELVIFLKATIIEAPEDTIHDTDREIYRKFAQDRRPFKL